MYIVKFHHCLSCSDHPLQKHTEVFSFLFPRSQNGETNNPVVCEAEDSFTCSIALDTTTSFVAMVTVSISDAVAPPVLLRMPARPGEKRTSLWSRSLFYTSLKTVCFPRFEIKYQLTLKQLIRFSHTESHRKGFLL